MTVEETKEDAVKFCLKASIMQIVEEMRQKADSITEGIDDLTHTHIGMAMRAERKWQVKDLLFFADKLEKVMRARNNYVMPTDKNLFDEYLEVKKKLDLLKGEVFSRIRDICELCTNINSHERITDFHSNEEPVCLDEPEVIVNVTSYDYGDYTYCFPKRYLTMTLDEIKADVECVKKLAEEEKQRAKTDAEYKQYLKLKEKFEKEEK